ncbi:MAG: chemotaxis protein CheD [Sulfuricellaceae bacterium]|nr:chemotaxis protein CheD [Sulfuricellaceae bacterium]
MKNPTQPTEVILQPGDFYFGGAATSIRTVLGSCVSVTLWHPTRLIGGMCHYMLPFRQNNNSSAGLDGRYAEESMQLFMRAIRDAATHPADYRVKLFGAGNMFPGLARKESCGPYTSQCEATTCRNVSCKNIGVARSLTAKYGFNVEAEDLGGDGLRQVVFDVWSGHVWVRKPMEKLGAAGLKQRASSRFAWSLQGG